ncbi:MAG: hypothetical protein ACOCVR_02340, partial [Myxococcota bacterium]
MSDEGRKETGRPGGGLLLIELAAVDRFHRAICYPYLFGFAKRAGIPVRWLRFGMKAARQLEMNETGVGLTKDESRALSRALEEMGPSHVL